MGCGAGSSISELDILLISPEDWQMKNFERAVTSSDSVGFFVVGKALYLRLGP